MAGVGASVEVQLEQVLDGLLRGRLDLHQLTPSLAGIYIAGFDAGRASLASDIERARDEAARWYEIAHNPGGQYPDMIRRRLDEAAARLPVHETDEQQYAALLAAATSPRRAA